MTTLNGTTHKVKGNATELISDVIMTGFSPRYLVLSPMEFAIGDTSNYHAYQHGGIARQVKVHKTVTFESLEQQLSSPNYLTADFAKMEAPLQTHVAMLALDKFLDDNKATPPRPR